MRTEDSAAHQSAATTRSIDHERYRRAVVETMTVTQLGPSAYEVCHDGETYATDLESVHCTCPDHEYRDARCKHLIRGALHAAFVEGVRTRFTAAVVRACGEFGCADGYDGCDGPTGDTLPCQTCIHGTSTGEWTVWSVLVGARPAREVTPDVGEGVDRGEGVATDGGATDTDPSGPRRGRSACKFCGTESADGVHIDHDDGCFVAGEREAETAAKWEALAREPADAGAPEGRR